MKRNEVLELLDYKIVLEEQKEYPNEDVITALSEAMFIISMIDDIEEDYEEEEVDTCYFCGEPVLECICDCDSCDSCDECTCCDYSEDTVATEEEVDKLFTEVLAKLLTENKLQQ